MKPSALLTLSGRDRPGIVARTTQVLFENGCNIADSSMTRLGGEFTVMLILHLPVKITTEVLAQRFRTLAEEMVLSVSIRPLSTEAEAMATASTPEHMYIVHVLGADQPGIVFQVTKLLAEAGGNVTDLYTQVVGSPEKPVYAMVIEIESDNSHDFLSQQLKQLEKKLDVEISLRPSELPLM